MGKFNIYIHPKIQEKVVSFINEIKTKEKEKIVKRKASFIYSFLLKRDNLSSG